MSIFCKIGLPGFVAPLAIGGAVLTLMLVSLTFIDKVCLSDDSCKTCKYILGQCNIKRYTFRGCTFVKK